MAAPKPSKLLVIRNLDEKDVSDDEDKPKILTPGEPADFSVIVENDGDRYAVGDMFYKSFLERVALRIKLGDKEKGQQNDKGHTLMEFLDALKPFFPPRSDGKDCPDDMLEHFATQILQQGIALGIQIAAGKIIPAKLKPSSD